MTLPYNYGNTHVPVVRRGQMNGTILETIANAKTAIDNYEKQSEELARTQEQAQFLIMTGTVLLTLGGIFLTYKFIKEVNKKGK